MTKSMIHPSFVRCLLVTFALCLLALGMTTGDADAAKSRPQRSYMSPTALIELCEETGGSLILIHTPNNQVIVTCYYADGTWFSCDSATGMCTDGWRQLPTGGSKSDAGRPDHDSVVLDPGSDSDRITGGEVAPLDSTDGILAEPEFEESASDIAPLESTDGVRAEDETSEEPLVFSEATYEIQYLAPIEPLP